MKISINNKTNLPFEIIGRVFDKYIESDLEVTIYEGKIDIEIFEYKKKEYKMTIEYKITQINITVEELDIEAKDVSMKGVRFPKLK